MNIQGREPEIWKPIVGFEGLYSISSWGRILSRKKEIFGWIDGPYRRVTLSKGEDEFTFKAHRLVGVHFIANPDECPILNHLDFDGLNNYYKNLEWATYSRNVQHAHDNKRIKRNRGIDSHMAKILVHNDYGFFVTVGEAAQMESKSHGQMAAIIRGEFPNTTKFQLT